METTHIGSCLTEASVVHQGWRISMSPEPGGPFGRTSVTAKAVKGGITISAQAWNEDMALEMIRDMIARREG
jgi:hypothetical protein